MSAMASQITGVSIVYSIVYLGADQREQQSYVSPFVGGNHRWPVNSPQRVSNTENVSIWWRHHVLWFIAIYKVVSVSIKH